MAQCTHLDTIQVTELPPAVQDSWFAFDHFFSDRAFPLAFDRLFRDDVHLTRFGRFREALAGQGELGQGNPFGRAVELHVALGAIEAAPWSRGDAPSLEVSRAAWETAGSCASR